MRPTDVAGWDEEVEFVAKGRVQCVTELWRAEVGSAMVEIWNQKLSEINLDILKIKIKKIIVKSNLPLISVEKKQSLHLKRVLMSD